MRFSCRCENLLQTGHQPACLHLLMGVMGPLLKELGYQPHTYPNQGMPFTSDNRYSKQDDNSTLFVDLHPCNHYSWYHLPPGIKVIKWKEAQDEQGFVKTRYGHSHLAQTTDITFVKDYLLNNWDPTLINKQSDWEALFQKLEKERAHR